MIHIIEENGYISQSRFTGCERYLFKRRARGRVNEYREQWSLGRNRHLLVRIWHFIFFIISELTIKILKLNTKENITICLWIHLWKNTCLTCVDIDLTHISEPRKETFHQKWFVGCCFFSFFHLLTWILYFLSIPLFHISFSSVFCRRTQAMLSSSYLWSSSLLLLFWQLLAIAPERETAVVAMTQVVEDMMEWVRHRRYSFPFLVAWKWWLISETAIITLWENLHFTSLSQFSQKSIFRLHFTLQVSIFNLQED